MPCSMSRAGALSALLAGALLGATAAHAASFDAEYVFGDSLSDNGNAAECRRRHLSLSPELS